MDQKKYFQQQLLKWHHTENKRQLPWKEEKDVYRIWLSEIILQQTRAEQGLKYYKHFTSKYPDIQKLAKAPLEEVYKLWEGLGYYNRCRNLHATAQKIAFELGGHFPDTYESILELKGIGPYTAAAIASFGFDLPYAVLDGNVFRVLSRFFGIDQPIDSSSGKKVFQHLAQECLKEDEAAAYNQAIMDFGATVCKPDIPVCKSCFMKNKCAAFAENKVAELPVKEKRIKQRSRWFLFYIIEQEGKFAIEKRTGKDVWSHLYQFPLSEYLTEREWEKTGPKTVEDWVQKQGFHQSFKVIAVTKPGKQQLSHQTIYAKAVLIRLGGNQKPKNKDWEWKTNRQLKELPFPKILNDFLSAKVTELFMLNDATVNQKT